MARQDLNASFLQTSFLYGANAAYIDELYARYTQDPASVDAEWQAFFGALREDGATVAKNADGPSWTRPNWPIVANGELVSALDGNWAQIEKATGTRSRPRLRVGASSSARIRSCRARVIRSKR